MAEPSKDTPWIVLAVARAVAVAAFPLVSWLPDALTPGKLMFAVPSKDTPPIVLALANAVADEEFPVKAPTKIVAVNVPELGL